MKKSLITFILFIIPLLFFITGCILKDAQGPYYLNLYDPSYVYLISSLNLAQGFGVGHFDHPGTTVQVIGAVIVKIYHWLSNGNTDIVQDVLSRPEDYLLRINRVLMGINSLTLFVTGIFVYRVTKNLLLTLMFQLSPLVSMEIFYGMIIVTPDNFLICATLLLTALLIYYLHRADEMKKVPLGLIAAFAIVCGLGLATKLNFLPLVIIPFLLIKGIKNKILFVFILMLSFILFILPSLSNLNSFIVWVQKIILFSGKYGTGSPTVIDTSTFPENLKLIFKKDPFFTFVYIVISITLLTIVFKKNKPLHPDTFFQKSKRLLILTFTAINFEIFLVAKQYSQYYLIPVFMLGVFSLFLSAIILSTYFRNNPARITITHLYFLIIVLVYSWGLWNIILSYHEATQQRTEAYKVGEFIRENYPGALVIPAFQSANLDCALAFSTAYGGSQAEKYMAILSKQQSHIFYNPWINQFYSISKENTKTELLHGQKLIFQNCMFGSPEEFIKTLNNVCGKKEATFKKVFENKYKESVYEINIGK